MIKGRQVQVARYGLLAVKGEFCVRDGKVVYQLQYSCHGLYELLTEHLPLLQESLENVEWDSPVANTMTDIKRQNPANKPEEKRSWR